MDRPNILLLLTDQQHHGMLSCAGNPWLRTPSLDQLAAGGTRLARCYATDPVCIPARFSLFTGRMPSAIGMRGNGGGNLTPFSPEDDRASLGWLLRSAGYRTWYGGKEHFPIGLDAARLGFDSYCRDERAGLAVAAASQVQAEAGRPGPWAMVASFINPHDICYQAIRAFAEQAYDRALLARGSVELATLDAALASAPADPGLLPPLPANHQAQRDEPSALVEALRSRRFKLRAREEWGEHAWRLHRWAYARLTEAVDAQLGTVLAALDASGQAGNTLVLMTSDHGDHDAAHRLEHKTFFYEEAARVPFLARLPGAIAAGQVDDRQPVSGLDLLPTVCDWAGAPVPGHCRGISLRPLLTAGAALPRPEVYGENVLSHMVCTQRWKYVRYDHGTHAEQLYDLDRDPGETRNHAGDPDHATVLAALRGRLEANQAEHAGLALPRAALRLPAGVDEGVPCE